MENQKIAQILFEIGEFLEIQEVRFKPYVYQKAAISLDGLKENVAEIYERGGLKALKKIPGVGESIAEKIEEYIKTGAIKYYENLKKKMPVKIDELTVIEGIGPKTVKALYKHLKVKDLRDLEQVAKQHKIRKLPGFQQKTEKNILQGIAFLKRSRGRFLLGDIFPEAEKILERLKTLKEVKQIKIAGSVRRMKETVGDVDILIISDHHKIIMDFFTSMPGVIKVWAKGTTRSAVRMNQGFDCDLRIASDKSYGSALQYFTGSKEHNIALRKIAIDKGLKLNEYGLFKNKKMIAGSTEREIYQAIGMENIAPELRENQGEIELALKHNLPKIIGYNDIKGDLHCHSKWNGGNNSIKELAIAAKEMGYEYLGISDHTKFLKIERGLDEKDLIQQRKEINELNFQFQIIGSDKFRILQGAEVNILNNGSIDINDTALKKLDYVIAGIHSNFKMPKEKMTERIIKAIKNPYINIISHPFGRILKKRDKYECDFNKILRAAKKFRTVLEINAQPKRFDLNDKNIRKCREMGVKMTINSDAHYLDHLKFMKFGIAQARRGWAEKKDIINTKSLFDLSKFFEIKIRG